MTNDEVKKKFAEKGEEMFDYLLYLYSIQKNVKIRYKNEGETKWKTPKKPK